jgi:hypothetical protein
MFGEQPSTTFSKIKNRYRIGLVCRSDAEKVLVKAWFLATVPGMDRVQAELVVAIDITA